MTFCYFAIHQSLLDYIRKAVDRSLEELPHPTTAEELKLPNEERITGEVFG
jgi:hypothetical protein